ncbi:unnamed protein product, partial [Mesorhabditis belari]|uniref:Uncharacterized protein n=1 Tax=Mesorhabditis belari TaxID=2138241 RepID=A0AAF3JC90_9BILA
MNNVQFDGSKTTRKQICQVCGETGASRHYGAITCGRCKVFFIRAVTVDKDYRCQANGNCTYPESKCRSCRYNRCIAVGMIPETVARREGCTRQLKRFSKPKTESKETSLPLSEDEDEPIDVETPMDFEETFGGLMATPGCSYQQIRFKPPTPPTFDDDEMCDQQPSTSHAFPSTSSQGSLDQYDLPQSNLSIVPNINWAIKTLGSNISLWVPDISKDVGGKLLALDKFCSQDAPNNRITPFSIALNMSIADLLENPTLLAPRGPLAWDDAAPPTTDRTQLTHMVFARKLVYYIDWLRGTEDFWKLSESDRNRLCCQQYNPMTCLTMFYNTYRLKNDGVLYGLGAQGKIDNTPMDTEYTVFNNFMIEYVQTYIVSTMREISFTQEEYVIFRNVFLFNTNLSLSEEGSKIVKEANMKYSAELLELLRKNNDRNSPEGALERRISKIFGLQPHILHVAYRSSRFFGRASALNVSNMRGALTHDLFFKET